MIGLGLGASHSALIESAAPVGVFDTKAFEFDGVSDILLAPTSVDIFNGSGGSISFWAKDDPFTSKTFITKYQSSTEYWQIGFQSTLLFFKAGGTGGSSAWYSDAITATLSNYNHFVISVDDSSASNFLANTEVYVNGVAQGTYFGGAVNSSNTIDFDNTGSIIIGGSTNVSRTHIDEMNEIAFFDTALDASNVTAIYNSGTPFDLTSDSGDYNSSSNLQLYIRGEETIGASPLFAFTDSSGNNHSCNAFGNSVVDSSL